MNTQLLHETIEQKYGAGIYSYDILPHKQEKRIIE